MLRMIITDKDNNEVKVVRSKNFNYIRREYRKFFYTGNNMNTRCYDYDVKFYIDDVEYNSFIDFEYSVKEVY